MKITLYNFGISCAKCVKEAAIRTFCEGCAEIKGREHMHCACTSCGFAWVEKPADASKSKGGRKR